MPESAQILDALPSPLVVVDAQGLVVRANRAFVALAGGVSVLGRPASEVVGRSDLQDRLAVLRSSSRRSVTIHGGPMGGGGDEETIWVGRLMDPEDLGGPVLLQGEAREDDVRDTPARRYRLLFESAGVGLVIGDGRGRIVDVNRAFADLVGYRHDELVGRSFEDLVHRDDAALVVPPSPEESGVGGRSWSRMLRVIREDGVGIPVRMVGSVLHGPDGQPRFSVSTIEDVRAEVEASDAWRRNEALFRAVFDRAGFGMALVDAYGLCVAANPSLAELVGVPQDDLVGQPLELQADAADRDLDRQLFDELLAGERDRYAFEMRMRGSDGRERRVRSNVASIGEATGAERVFLRVLEDITDQWEQDRALREFVEHAPAGLVMLDRRFRPLQFSRRWLSEFGIEESRARSRSFFDGHFPVPERWVDVFDACLRGDLEVADGEDEVCLDDGRRREWIRWEVRPVRRGGRTEGLLLFCEIVTGRVLAQQVVERQRRFLQQVLDTSPSPIFVKDLRGRTTLANRALRELPGGALDARDVASAHWMSQEELSERVRRTEQDVLAHGEAVDVDQPVSAPDGASRWFQVRRGPLRDDDGEITGLIGVASDITARRQAEGRLRAWAMRLETSNRELRDFAYVASHDLQEPLRKILVFADRLHATSAACLGEKAQHDLERIRSSARRMQDLIQAMLNLSRVATGGNRFEAVALDEVLRQVTDDFVVTLEQCGGRVQYRDLGEVRGDRVQLRQLFQNLVGNALKFRVEGTPPMVEITSREEPAGAGEASPWRVVEVRDNGIGFDERYLDRIFHVFQRLHGRGEYEGTGIGLAICRRIVERHGGTITARSRPGEGATFIVRLPVRPGGEEGEET